MGLTDQVPLEDARLAILLAEAQAEVCRATERLEALRANAGHGLFVRWAQGKVSDLGPDAVVITPGSGLIILGGRLDEARAIHDQEWLARFCADVTADPRWSTRPSDGGR